MQIPNSFKLRTGAIQLAELDANFDIIQVTVNQQADSIAKNSLDISNLVTSIANFSAIPIGCIVMWGGSVATIPSGWRLCDGTNGTPDLRDRFVIGARSDSSGPATTFVTAADTKTGGSKDLVAVSHGHTATSSATSSGSLTTDTDAWNFSVRVEDGGTFIPVSATGVTNTQTYDLSKVYSGSNWAYQSNSGVSISRSVSHTHTPTITTAVTTTVTNSGETGTNKNLPPYYALAYIMKV